MVWTIHGMVNKVASQAEYTTTTHIQHNEYEPTYIFFYRLVRSGSLFVDLHNQTVIFFNSLRQLDHELQNKRSSTPNKLAGVSQEF